VRRIPIAIISAAGLLVALSACASTDSPDGSGGGTSTAGGCEVAPSGAASDAVKVTGEFGAAPEVTFEGPLEPDTTQRTVVIEGEAGGDEAVLGSTANILYSVYNGATGAVIDQWDYASDPAPFTIDPATFIVGVVDALECSVPGDRVVAVVPAAEAFGEQGQEALGLGAGESLVFVADIVSVEAAPEPVTPSEWTENVPEVDLGADVPVVTIPATAAPTDLVLKVLEQGDGAVVEAGQTVELDYQGTSWDTGEVFDQSYGTGGSASFATTQVIEGFGAALVGQKVGTTLIVSIPPQYAYGTDAAAHALGGQTLVFLIHIIGVS